MHRQLRRKYLWIIPGTLLFVFLSLVFLPVSFTGDNNNALPKLIAILTLIILIAGFISMKIWHIRKSIYFLHADNNNTLVPDCNNEPEAQIKTDNSGNIVYINDLAEKLTGWRKIEALNQPVKQVFDVVAEYNAEQYVDVASRVLHSCKNVPMENHAVLRSKDSIHHKIWNRGEALFNNQGNMEGVLINFREIKNNGQSNSVKDFDKSYWNLVEQASDAIMVTDMRGNLIKVNESFYKLLGYTRREIKTLTAFELYDAKDLEKDPLQFAGVRTGQSLIRERNMLHKNGTTVAVELNIKMIDGDRLLAIIRDIRERKIAEEAIRKSNERFKIIAEATNDALWEWNQETNEFWANKTYQELYDLTLADPVPTEDEWKSRIHPEDKEKVLTSIAEALASETNTWAGEYRMRTKNGWAYIYGQTYIVRDEQGKPIRLMGNMTNITSRKKTEEETRLAIERYDILARATSDTIWDWDVEKNTMKYNNGISHMFGYETGVDNVVDWWNEKIHPDDFCKVKDKVDEVFAKRQDRFQLIYRFRCGDGSYKNIFDRAFALFDHDGTPYRVIGAMQDITYHVQEDARMGKAIMDAQEQERQYIGAELHDNVNQILAGALLMLGMVKENKTGTKEIFEYVETGKTYVNNAINEVRKLSHELAPASFDESTLKDAFENLVSAFNVEKRYEIRLSFDEQCNVLPEEIQINLYRILQEQLKNIIRHAEATEICISTALIGSVVLMIISDNGKGFNIKTKKKGIGLNNIKKRVSLLSGKCNIQSEEGHGCKISIEIPIDVVPLTLSI